MDQNYRAYIGRSHFGDLDGLRFLCIALVLWHHGNPMLNRGPQIFERGFMGVDFFFVLSGFLITTLLLRETRRHGSFSLLDFYRRRILRILPPFYLLVTVVSLYYVVIKGQSELARLVPYYYLFLSNFLTEDISVLGITWSLSVEEQYYAVWPLLLALLPRRAIVPVLVALIAVNVLVGAGVMDVDAIPAGPLLIRLPTATYAPILMGSLAAWLLDRAGGYAVFNRLTGWAGAPVVFLGLVLVLFQMTPRDVNGWPNLAIHGAMTLALVSLVIGPSNVLSPLLRWGPVARFGQVSYGIYLYHLIALHVGHAVLGRIGIDHPWLVLPVYSLLSWGMAEVSFRYYESRFLALRRKPPEAVPALVPRG